MNVGGRAACCCLLRVQDPTLGRSVRGDRRQPLRSSPCLAPCCHRSFLATTPRVLRAPVARSAGDLRVGAVAIATGAGCYFLKKSPEVIPSLFVLAVAGSDYPRIEAPAHEDRGEITAFGRGHRLTQPGGV